MIAVILCDYLLVIIDFYNNFKEWAEAQINYKLNNPCLKAGVINLNQ